MNDSFDLQALQAKRDAAIAKFERWECDAAELLAAYATGERNFIRANLDGANLDGANLDGANLYCANLDGANLIRANLGFGAIANYWTLTRIGSHCAELQVAYTSAGDIRIKRGCSGWLTPDEFLARVEKTHGDNLHSRVYSATVAYIKARVTLELAETSA